METQQETETQEVEYDFLGLSRFNPKVVDLLEPTF
jgi:hypothetical protein